MATVTTRELRGGPQLVRPTEIEIGQARDSGPKLKAALGRPGAAVRVVVRGEDGSEDELDVPPSALALLGHILATMAHGDAVMLDPIRAQLTTFAAADLIGVSVPFVEGLIEAGELPSHEYGTIRRVMLDDLMAYKEESDRKRREILDEMVALNQEMGLY